MTLISLRFNYLKKNVQFCKLGDNFFYFDKISKMRSPEPKNAFLKGAKKQKNYAF